MIFFWGIISVLSFFFFNHILLLHDAYTWSFTLELIFLLAVILDPILLDSCCVQLNFHAAEMREIIITFVLNGFIAPKLMWCSSCCIPLMFIVCFGYTWRAQVTELKHKKHTVSAVELYNDVQPCIYNIWIILHNMLKKIQNTFSPFVTSANVFVWLCYCVPGSGSEKGVSLAYQIVYCRCSCPCRDRFVDMTLSSMRFKHFLSLAYCVPLSQGER